MTIDFLPLLPLHHHPREGEGRGEAGSSQVSLDLRKADQQRGFYARHLVSTVPRLGVGAIQGMGQQKPCPYPQSRTGAMTPNLAAEKHGGMEKRRQKGGDRQGPPRSPEGKKFEGTDTGGQGLSVLHAAWQGRHPLPQGYGYCIAHVVLLTAQAGSHSLMGRGLGLGGGQILAPRHLTSSRA